MPTASEAALQRADGEFVAARPFAHEARTRGRINEHAPDHVFGRQGIGEAVEREVHGAGAGAHERLPGARRGARARRRGDAVEEGHFHGAEGAVAGIAARRENDGAKRADAAGRARAVRFIVAGIFAEGVVFANEKARGAVLVEEHFVGLAGSANREVLETGHVLREGGEKTRAVPFGDEAAFGAVAAELQKTTVPTDAAVGEKLFDAGGVLRHDEGELIVAHAARDAEHVARERFGAVLDAALFLLGRAHAGEVEARKA